VDTYRLPAGFSTAEEMIALGMAKNLLTLYRNTPIYDSALHLLESITAPLSGNNDNHWYENRIVVPPVPTAIIDAEVWEVITASLRNNKVITFDYFGAWDTKFNLRRVRPYQLLFDGGVWYLYGYAEERKDIRVFSLPRMKNVALTDTVFPLPKDYDYGLQNNNSSFGVFAGGNKKHYSIAFYNDSVMWIKERVWARDQEIEETDDGIIISFTSTQYHKVLEWVLSRGACAKPLEPAELVNDWKKYIKKMMDISGLREAQNKEMKELISAQQKINEYFTEPLSFEEREPDKNINLCANIAKLAKQGWKAEEIAKALRLTIDEVQLIIEDEEEK
jgi:predicted DNA-binding transcriptional regulator YafY